MFYMGSIEHLLANVCYNGKCLLQWLQAQLRGAKLGTAHVELRMAIPVTELYHGFLDSHP